MIGAILWRDLARAAQAGAALPVAFFLLVATLFPFAIGPDAALLARTGGGVLWMAALLAAMLPIDRLIAPDAEAGVLDQFAARGIADEAVAAAKLGAHWLASGPPLIIAAVPGAALLGLDTNTLIRLELGLLLATPALAGLALMVSAVTAGLRGAGALAGLLMLPLAVPILIFGAGDASPGALKLLGAAALLITGTAPFAAGAALRGLRT